MREAINNKKTKGPEMLATEALERSFRIRRFADLLMDSQIYVLMDS